MDARLLYLDPIYDDNVSAGWKPGQFRIVEENDGHALQEFKPTMGGQPEWVRVFFSTDREAVERAHERRAV